jgi:DNA-binding transcriptional regulator LsrR (DeoR family)
MSTAPLEELRMLTRVARLYHTERLRQAEVAERLSLSQSGVSRALRRASELGIVRTVVVPPPGLGGWINVLTTDVASARRLTEERP